MTQSLARRSVLRAAGALCLPMFGPPAQACEYFSSTLRIGHPWTRATAHGATQATVCMTLNEVTTADCLIGLETPVAQSAEFVSPDGSSAGPLALELPAGSETVLGETGLRLRLLGLHHALEVARSYPLILTFRQSGRVSAVLNVDYQRFS